MLRGSALLLPLLVAVAALASAESLPWRGAVPNRQLNAEVAVIDLSETHATVVFAGARLVVQRDCDIGLEVGFLEKRKAKIIALLSDAAKHRGMVLPKPMHVTIGEKVQKKVQDLRQANITAVDTGIHGFGGWLQRALCTVRRGRHLLRRQR